MSSNIFNGCKTMGDLYNIFVYNPDVTFETATDAELNRLADVFEANVAPADMVDTPLGETEFNHIRAFVITKVNGAIEDIETINTITNNKEDEGMATNFKQTLEDAAKEIAGVKENKQVATVEEFINDIDKDVAVLHGTFGKIIKVLDDFTGLSAFKADLLDAYHAGERGKNKKDLQKVAKNIREKIDTKLKDIDELSDLGLMDSGEAKKLKDVLEELKGSNIFDKIVGCLAFLAKKAFSILSEVFEKQCKRQDVFGSICRGMGEFVKALRAGLKIVWDTTKFVISFIVAGAMIIAGPIVKAIMSLAEKFTGWVKKKFTKVKELKVADDFEEEFEDDFEEEDAE